MIIWDEGPLELLGANARHLSFILDGHKLHGRFALTETGPERWILVKGADHEARPGTDIVAAQPRSVRSGRTWQELADVS